MQLFLTKGKAGNQQLLDEKVVEEFTRVQFKGNRRGAGFDKPTGDKDGPTYTYVSRESFGHTGFTGTIAWADPDKQIVYIFLANRTYPNANLTNKLLKYNIRTRIQEVIYNSMKEQVN